MKIELDFIRNIYDDYDVIIDTHTADGVKASIDHLVTRLSNACFRNCLTN